ncbi:hypothetical protein A2526_00710 [candidate division WOR-1 bacterium RIFOXYD2_FULL_36_8]|nr:MAG: hypothetical protein A2526_00710 [candidate division WOR-1 bacterium RIFOXYD2_FULL_36_8]
MQIRFKIILVVIILFILSFSALKLSRVLPVESSKTFQTMGTFVTIKLKSTDAKTDIQTAYNKIKELEKKLNRFDPQSEVSKINNANPYVKIKISKDTYNCIALAKQVSKVTNGAFDITLSGNYQNINLNPNDYSIEKLKKDIYINLDGIAKGFAVEKARDLLFKRGIKDGIIDATSSIAIFEIPKRIGIKDPFKKDHIFEDFILGHGKALSTSGIYEQGNHIINPKTGKTPKTWVSVTVIGQDAGFLDGLSTGLFVMEEREALSLLKELYLSAILIKKDGKVIKVNYENSSS